VKIIFSDYDGTLCRSDIETVYEVSQHNVDMIKKWRAAGNLFGLATGRDPHSFNQVWTVERDILDFFILCNGAQIYKNFWEPMLYRESDGSLVPELCKTVFECGGDDIYIAWGRDGRFVISPEGKPTRMSKGLGLEVLSFADAPQPEVLHYMGTYFPTDEACVKFRNLIAERFAGKFEAFPHGSWSDVSGFGINKATGIAAYLEHTGLKPEAIITVGDNYNDLPMLAAYDGYAMESAPAEVIAAAKGRTIKSVGELIEELLKNG